MTDAQQEQQDDEAEGYTKQPQQDKDHGIVSS
jgi:hypothetical protein